MPFLHYLRSVFWNYFNFLSNLKMSQLVSYDVMFCDFLCGDVCDCLRTKKNGEFMKVLKIY